MSETTVPVTDQTFRELVLETELPVLVDFWAPWCGPCQRIAPVLEELAEEFQGRLRIAKVNTEQEYVQAGEFGVQGIPTMILFHKGNEVDRLVGAVPKLVLQLWLEESIGGWAVTRPSFGTRRTA